MIRRFRSLLVLACVLCLVLEVIAQFRGRRGPRTFEGPLERGNVPEWKVDDRFPKDTFTFARLKYRSSGSERSSFAWWTDYPDADLNLCYRLQQLTSIKVQPEPKVLEITDPELSNYPWVFMSGVGNILLDDLEAAALRNYLLSGGFMMVDDFWGQAEWDGFHSAMKQVFPEREPVDLPRSHPIFRCVFPLPEDLSLQTTNIGNARANRDSGVTWEDNHEGGNTRDVHFRAIFDENNRMMVMICHNTDNGDGWEEEGVDPWFFTEFSEKNVIHWESTLFSTP